MALAKQLSSVCLLWTLCAAGCAQPLPAELPAANSLFYFPGAVAVLPGDQSAYVANTNFDQRYDAGWLTHIDLPVLAQALQAGQSLLPAFAREQRVPSLGGDLVLTADGRAAYLSHRGLGYVTKLDAVLQGGQQALSCGDGGGNNGLDGYLARTDCDAAHLLPVKARLADEFHIAHSRDKERLNDPVALAPRGPSDAWLGFLSDARVVSMADVEQAIAQQLLRSGPKGATYRGLTALGDGSLLACGSRGKEDRLGAEALISIWPADANDGNRQDIYPSRAFADGRAAERAAASIERAVMGGNDGSLYLLSHGPEAVLVLRPAPATRSGIDDATDVVSTTAAPPGYDLFEAYPLPNARLTDLLYLPRSTGDLLVAVSLERDALYFFDVSGARLQLAARLRLETGRGPYRAAVAKVGQVTMLLVTTFFDHGLSVVDLSPARPADFVAASMQDPTIVSRLVRP